MNTPVPIIFAITTSVAVTRPSRRGTAEEFADGSPRCDMTLLVLHLHRDCSIENHKAGNDLASCHERDTHI